MGIHDILSEQVETLIDQFRRTIEIPCMKHIRRVEGHFDTVIADIFLQPDMGLRCIVIDCIRLN